MDTNTLVGFWDVHSILFVICMFFFPRLTLLFATAWGGILWWVGLIFMPRLTVAILATTYYWQTNPILCVITWFWALALEGAEKKTVRGICGGRRA